MRGDAGRPLERAIGVGGHGLLDDGSSEACMLAGLALKHRWAARVDDRMRRPNLVMGANVQVCLERFCRYWDVEPRIVPMSGSRYHLDAAEAVALCDQDTIGVVAILGSTFDGSYEPVADIVAALDQLAAGGVPDVPVHVDGASDAMIAPFLDPQLVWDFRLGRVTSINTSGHKYGLVYPGVGWVLWRDTDSLPRELIFDVNYLGGHLPTFALNFPPVPRSSRSATPSSGSVAQASGPSSRAAATWRPSCPAGSNSCPSSG